MEKVNVHEKFDLFDEHWSPRIIAELNGQHVKIVKIKGEFVWHHHDHEDEMFFVMKGRMVMQLRDGDIALEAGEMLVVPKGVEHRPVAEDETQLMLIEPAGTLNTGNTVGEMTVTSPQVL
jgi:mannose-6-phosphate isomerase-like protein (cupin superfamily)